MIDDNAFSKPSYWLDRALAARKLAHGFRQEEHKLALQAVAEKYETMALWAERNAGDLPAPENC